MTTISALILRHPLPGDEPAFLQARAAVPPDQPTLLRDYRADMDYAAYLRLLDDYRHGRGLPPGVARSTFLFAFVGQSIVGRASIRHALVPPLGESAGHIGFSVLPEARNRGHATQIMRHATRFAHAELGLEWLLVTCDDDNAASRRVIEKCHGVFADTWHDPSLRRPKRRYWIDARIADRLAQQWPDDSFEPTPLPRRPGSGAGAHGS